jgi:glycosyltransferase involved in cell wall biosynthesis
MRIAYVITRGDVMGGASVHVREMSRAMLDRGHSVLVMAGGAGDVADQLAAAGVPFRTLRFLRRPVRPARDLRALAEITGMLREWKPDLVSTHTAKAGWLGRAACSRLGLPAIYTPHGWSISDRVSPAGGIAFRLAEKWASRWANAIVCVCEYERRLALAKRVAPREKLFVVHNGVADTPPELRARPGRSPVRIVSVARLEPPKDCATLLAALGRLRELDWKLDLVGGGPLEPEVRRMAQGLGIAGRVRFLGYQTDPAPTLAASQVFVLSSRSEGFPRSVLEAMRAGLPVVASDVGGVGEAVRDGVEGLLVPRRNPDALANALARLLAGASERERLGAAARRRYESSFRIEKMVEKTAAIYATVLVRRPENLGRT